MVKGFKQKPGVHYTEVFALITRLERVSLVVILARSNGWSLSHMNAKSAFLNGTLDELVYVTQTPGFEIKGKESMVYKLNKALYGLKQAPRACKRRIDLFFFYPK